MKDGSRGTIRERRLLPQILLTVEVALAMVLAAGAGLLSTSLVQLYRSGLGFDPKGVLLASPSMDNQPREGAELLHFYRDLHDDLSRLPGVTAVGYASVPPLSDNIMESDLHVPGGGDRSIYVNNIGPGYFQAMRIPLLGGRDFTWQDAPETGNKVVLNQAAAKMFFPSGNAIGSSLESTEDGKTTAVTVVGVARDTKYLALREAAPPTVYYPMAQASSKGKFDYTAVVRTSGSMKQLAPAVRQTIARLANDIPSSYLTTMSEQVDDSIAAERVMAILSIFFALSGLLVTGIGLYGVLAYSTARRTSEIGIRMALGAERSGVVGLIFRENAWVAAGGCFTGAILAVLTSRTLAAFLYGVSPHDPWVIAGSLFLLCLIAAVASLIPALRAANVDPMKALRTD